MTNQHRLEAKKNAVDNKFILSRYLLDLCENFSQYLNINCLKMKRW